MKSKLLFLFPRSESIPFSSQTLMLVPMLNTHRLKSVFYLFIYLPFCSQTSILVSMLNVHRLESAGHTMLINHAVRISKTAPPIKIQCAPPMVQHMTTNAGTN